MRSCCSSAHSHPVFSALEVFEQHVHRCRGRERASVQYVSRFLSSFLYIWEAPAAPSEHLAGEPCASIQRPLCGLHHCHPACIWQMAVVFTSTSTAILWNTIHLCCCALYGLLFPGRLCLLLTGILHFSCSHKTLNRLIRSLCGALEMFLNYLLPLEAGVSFSTWSCSWALLKSRAALNPKGSDVKAQTPESRAHNP